ncbi:uncharacterized protein BO97DRAFT_378948 [Aspergillus homomorphus CBS 101889]|uniref:Protein ROT1 n=1 Tax=Aspergillus homomorphus (strain CBS 101889) TaxID=1450537 RepID=A0A395HH35_ASPHC|nr:hypothetical protein BO97DRAFT_378948 [Aspergillus homomorphus CBS 101889]RAL07211.1 hypothetical protein BO97DRAFT_378948 [Aspergillus homomorphus CBS 101889]
MITGYFLFTLLLTAVGAASVSDLVGTWTTKSRKVVTGPGFYDPINDRFLEPNLTGISYSFNEDGSYEEAYYRAIANPQDPACPKGLMQWQHGTYTAQSDGSLVLTPFADDGRQLVSDPCASPLTSYTRYNQTETFKSFTVSVDRYHGVQRLDLYAHDGSPMHPMYLVYRPPQMLPTRVLNPIDPKAKKQKRHMSGDTKSTFSLKGLVPTQKIIEPDRLLWLGVIMTAVGGITVFCT